MDILMAKVEEPTPLVNPPEGVMDRIHFVINNVTTSNLSSKVGLPRVLASVFLCNSCVYNVHSRWVLCM